MAMLKEENDVRSATMNHQDEDVRERGLEMLESTGRFQRLMELDSGMRSGNPDSPHAIQMHKIRRKHFTHNEPMLLSKTNILAFKEHFQN